MPGKLESPKDITYWIAHGPKTCWFGVTGKNLWTASGEPNFETFTDETEFLDRLSKFKDIGKPELIEEFAAEKEFADEMAKKTTLEVDR